MLFAYPFLTTEAVTPVIAANANAEVREEVVGGVKQGKVVIAIGYSAPYPKQSLWLRLDLPHLRLVTEPTVAETTRVVRKRFGEPGFLLPPTDRAIEAIGSERRQHMQENLRWLQSHEGEFQLISAYHRNFRYAFIPDLDADASIYQTGFLPRADEALCRAFHAAAFDGKVEIAPRFSNPEARILESLDADAVMEAKCL